MDVLHRQRIFKVLQYVQQHLHEPLDLPALARVASLSPSHFKVVFRGLTGESVYQHVKRLRLERAAMLLRYHDTPVLEVALACGFDSHEGFSRAFRQAFSCSPRTFRRGHRSPELPAPTGLHYRPDGVLADFQPVPDRSGDLKVRLVELPPRRLACVRHVGPYTEAIRAWPKLLWWAWRRGRLGADVCLLGVSWDDEAVTAETNQRYDAALVVEDSFQGEGVVGAYTLPGGLFAATTVVGSQEEYFGAGEVFAYQWLPQSGFYLRAPFFQMDRYHVPAGCRNPLSILTAAARSLHVDLHVPIAKGNGSYSPME